MKYILLGLSLFISMTPAFAFYVQEAGDTYIEARGLVYIVTSNVGNQQINGASARLMLDTDVSAWHIEYQQVWQQVYTNNNPYQTQADRLNLSYSSDTTQIKLGRQAINLTTTFFFSPNDFFAPFTVQSLNRDFKQGVDALYIEQQIGELSQISLIAVNNHDESLPTSSILKLESTWGNMSWSILAGKIYTATPFMTSNQQQIFGASIQADLTDTLGLRSEGHISKSNGDQTIEYVIGLEQRLSENLMLSGEYFHHGAAKPLVYLPYLGKRFLALGANYQITPLLTGQFGLIRQMNDQSMLATAYLNYSLSDESTLNISLLLPSGDTSSEFKQYPKAISLDYQIYF